MIYSRASLISILLLSILISTTSQAQSDSISAKVIYGNDDRRDLFEVSDTQWLEAAKSTVALMNEKSLIEVGGGFTKIDADSFGDGYYMCESEPYRDQPTGAFCSGFLVKDDIVVTAGHCIRSSSCESTRFVFDYAKNQASSDPSIVENTNIYGCKEVIESVIKNSGEDFAVVRLDRKVSDRKPLTLRNNGAIPPQTDITVIGHPVGLPTKVASGAKVREHKTAFFVANLDTYGGNSGSAVFNDKTGKVEGILVRGATDFTFNNNCRESNHCKDDECRGEDVTAITAVLPYIPQ